jgi:hypothetical protein
LAKPSWGVNFDARALRVRPANGSDLVGRTNSRRAHFMQRDIYSKVPARIIAELEAGAAPWIKP